MMKNKAIHRLVAETFLENDDPENKTVVMHLDNDTMNNHVSNLKWGTQSENLQQAVRDGRKNPPLKHAIVTFPYEIYNDNGEIYRVNSRDELAETICYAKISLKNMVGNGHVIDQGPYKGYKIRRIDTEKKIITNALIFFNNNTQK